MPAGPENSDKLASNRLFTPKEIRNTRITRFSSFAGNGGKIARLQQRAIGGDFDQKLLIIGPYGCGKTSLARHEINVPACHNPDPQTGDPCEDCPTCRSRLPEDNGTPGHFPRYEVDCGINNTRAQLLPYIEVFAGLDCGAVFLDEFHAVGDKATQRMFHKVAEDFPGLFIIAVTDVGMTSLSPDLFERFDKVVLTMPTVQEIVRHFERETERWGVHATQALITELVTRSRRSFRTCHRVFAAAAENPDRTLDMATIDEYLDPS